MAMCSFFWRLSRLTWRELYSRNPRSSYPCEFSGFPEVGVGFGETEKIGFHLLELVCSVGDVKLVVGPFEAMDVLEVETDVSLVFVAALALDGDGICWVEWCER